MQLFDSGYVGITAPRSLSNQETNGNSLVRYDTLSSNVSSLNSSISSVSSALNSFRTTVAATYVTAVRLGGRVGMNVGGDTQEYGTGYVITGGVTSDRTMVVIS